MRLPTKMMQKLIMWVVKKNSGFCVCACMQCVYACSVLPISINVRKNALGQHFSVNIGPCVQFQAQEVWGCPSLWLIVGFTTLFAVAECFSLEVVVDLAVVFFFTEMCRKCEFQGTACSKGCSLRIPSWFAAKFKWKMRHVFSQCQCEDVPRIRCGWCWWHSKKPGRLCESG